MYSDERYVLRAVKAGARGYILKNSAGDELIQAILHDPEGHGVFQPRRRADLSERLCPRLKDVSGINDRSSCSPTASGRSTSCSPKATATRRSPAALNLSLHTVETHRWRIMEKLDLHSTAELVLSAVRRGMVT